MTGQVLTFEDLRRLCSPDPDAPAPRASTVVRWARDQGILYKYDGRGGIWTTVAALNAALGLSAATVEPHNTELV
ncbi:hypothetical protein [Xanthomonas translucens]|uniref:hypothetical protein n=1 Tax=Xanthomonas campestris pv. translucens TaxID=343 RepID=UPI00071E9391|nr:hypothetical protein [Xanthomonas translucens]MCT8273385.1 hypothetical protein [Xanthomonas translucens pv. translucens]MCT8277471.1 hypothetical protein [Xanthomonas translucens pv. translucens]MCT8306336.1 hypothetical protein [Xanthomonas translucens pv. translucens]QSQ38902.1 hypothetical protein ISN32_05425 [Xanthomonas translucens pv. translucens]UII65629.1 hypothetical protein LV507_08125 [Xanthomonas translucens]